MTISRLSSNSIVPAKTIPWGNFSNVATGTYSDASGQWKYVSFTAASSTLTITDSGYFDCLIIGGGARGYAATWNGTGGGFIIGIQYLNSGSYTVTVGAGSTGTIGSAPAAAGAASSIGSVLITQKSSATDQNQFGSFTTYYPGIFSSITGSSLEYARGAAPSPRTNFGDGGTQASSTAGSSGIVIVRVKTN